MKEYELLLSLYSNDLIIIHILFLSNDLTISKKIKKNKKIFFYFFTIPIIYFIILLTKIKELRKFEKIIFYLI